MRVFDCAVLSPPNPCIVQGSAVQAEGKRGSHWCIWMSLDHSRERARRGTCGEDQPGQDTHSLFVRWGLVETGSFKNVQCCPAASFAHVPYPVRQRILSVLPLDHFRNLTSQPLHCCQNLPPGLGPLPLTWIAEASLSEFPASSCDPLHFIFHTAARVNLLRLVSYVSFLLVPLHWLPFLLRMRYQVFIVVFDLIYMYFPFTGHLTGLWYTNRAPAAGPLHLLFPLPVPLFTGYLMAHCSRSLTRRHCSRQPHIK